MFYRAYSRETGPELVNLETCRFLRIMSNDGCWQVRAYFASDQWSVLGEYDNRGEAEDQIEKLWFAIPDENSMVAP